MPNGDPTEVEVRLVDLQLDVERPVHLALHPRLTVLTGDVSACTRVAEVLGRVFALAGTEVFGTLEFSGFISPLDQTTIVSLDIPGQGLTVVTAADLPQPDRRRHEAEVGAVMARRDLAITESRRLSEMKAQLSRRLQATQAAAQVGSEEHDAIQRRLVEVRERITGNENAVREAEAGLLDRQQTLVELGERLAEQTVTAPALVSALDPIDGSAREIHLGDDVSAQRALVARGLACGLLEHQWASGLDTWLLSISEGTAPPDPAVAELRDEIVTLEQRWSEQSSVGVESEPDVLEARERHEELVKRLAALEGLNESGVLVEQARREIDEAHAARVELEGGRGRGRQLEEAAAREEEVTARYGFASYLDYTIALSTRSVGEAVQTTLDEARRETEEAMATLTARRDRAAASRHLLTEERAALRERFRELAGMDVEHLSLESIGRITAVPPELMGLAERLKSCVSALDQQRVCVAGEIEQFERWRTQLGGEGEVLRGELSQLSDTSLALTPLIQAAWTQYEEAARSGSEVEAQIAALAAEVAAAEGELEALALEDPVCYSATDVPVVTAHLGPLVDPPVSEPTPVVLADTFRGLGPHAISALEAMMVAALRVQVVYVTDDPAILQWARSLDQSAGQLVRLHKPGWFQRRLARRGDTPQVISEHR